MRWLARQLWRDGEEGMAEVTAAKFEPEAQDERRRERYEGELECRLDLNGASWRPPSTAVFDEVAAAS
jgi:hypothetical protein